MFSTQRVSWLPPQRDSGPCSKYHHLERCYWPPHKRAAPLSSTPSRSSLLIGFLLTHIATWYSSPCRLLSVSYIRASAPRGQAYRFVCCCTFHTSIVSSTRPVSSQCMSNGHKNEPLHCAQLLLFSLGFGSEHLCVTLFPPVPPHTASHLGRPKCPEEKQLLSCVLLLRASH